MQRISKKIDNLIERYLRESKFYDIEVRAITHLWLFSTIVRICALLSLVILFFVDGFADPVSKVTPTITYLQNIILYVIYAVLQLTIVDSKVWLRLISVKFVSRSRNYLETKIKLIPENYFPKTWNKNDIEFCLALVIDLFFYYSIILQTDQTQYDTYLLLSIPILWISFFSTSIKGIFAAGSLAISYYVTFHFFSNEHLMLPLLRSAFLFLLGVCFSLSHFIFARIILKKNEFLRQKEIEQKISNTFDIMGTDRQVAGKIMNIIVNEIEPESKKTLGAALFGAYAWRKTLILKGIAGCVTSVHNDVTIKYGSGLIGKVAQTHEMISCDNVMKNDNCKKLLQYVLPSETEKMAAIFIPMMDNQNNFLGVLIIYKNYQGIERNCNEVIGDDFLKRVKSLVKHIGVHYFNSVMSLKGRRDRDAFELSRKMEEIEKGCLKKSSMELIYKIAQLLNNRIKTDKTLCYEYDDFFEALVLKNEANNEICRTIDKENTFFKNLIQKKTEKNEINVSLNQGFFPKKYQNYICMPLFTKLGELNALLVFLRMTEKRKASKYESYAGPDRRLIEPHLLLVRVYWYVNGIYQRSLLREKLRQQRSQLDDILNDVNTTFTKLKRSEILPEAAKFAIKVVNAEACTIYLFDESNQKLTLKMAHGFEGRIDELIDRFQFDLPRDGHAASGLPAYIFTNPDRPLIANTEKQFNSLQPLSRKLENLYKTLPYYRNLSTKEKKNSVGINSYIGLALKTKEQGTIGVLQVYNKKVVAQKETAQFTERNIDYLKQFADTISLALEKTTEIERINKQQDSIAAALIHELRQPVVSVIAYKEALDKYNQQKLPASDDRIAKAIQGILKSIDKISDISNSLNDAFAVNRINIGFVKVEDILDSTLQENVHLVHNNNRIKITKRYQNKIKRIFLDPLKIQQVFNNLISNAVAAMPNGGSLKLSTKVSKDEFIIEVEDTGVGIPNWLNEKIFLPFQTTKKPDKGMGIGLTISKNIVTAHGGKLNFESKEGLGTVFRIILPLNRIKNQKEGIK